MLEHLVPCPDYKLLTVKNIPQMSEKSKDFSCYQWHGLLKHLRQMLIADAAMEEGTRMQSPLFDFGRTNILMSNKDCTSSVSNFC